MIILGFETSCDETSVSIVENGLKILSLETFSQIEIHKLYDGVVPEVASRNHIIKISPLLKQALKKSNLKLSDIHAVAVSNRPGLIGSLLVGINFAKGISWSYEIPIVYINHIFAHVYSVFFNNKVEFPCLALVISGGHTLLYKCNNVNNYELIGRTLDDAAGEALDKGAKLLGLGYPGGPILEKKSQSGNSSFVSFPIPNIKKGDNQFSYSGLKTALLNYIKNNSQEHIENHISDIAASYQYAAFYQLLLVVKKALFNTGISNLIVCGGVSANDTLRQMLSNDCDIIKNCINIFYPEKVHCGDNAAMVAGLAYHQLNNQSYNVNSLFSNAYSRVVKKGNK